MARSRSAPRSADPTPQRWEPDPSALPFAPELAPSFIHPRSPIALPIAVALALALPIPIPIAFALPLPLPLGT